MLKESLATLTTAARQRGWSDAEWARRAGVRKETLSRVRGRGNCDFATLNALAEVVGAAIVAVSRIDASLTADQHFPIALDRSAEERLLEFAASRWRDPDLWRAAGPTFFMAGLAVMLASTREFDRTAYLALGERLHPGASEPGVFARWLERSPIASARFVASLRQRLAKQ